MRKIEEEQPELHKKLPAKFHPFMSTKFFDKFFPIHYLNVLAITESAGTILHEDKENIDWLPVYFQTC